MEGNFGEFIARERERLNTEKNGITEQITGLTGQRDALDRELAAIDAYEKAKAGTPVQVGKGGGKNRGAAVARSRRGSKREGLLALIKENPAGLRRADILEKMGLKGDKAGEMSVSNALTALTKSNQVARSDGKYVPAAA